jgi:hypothetical protein
MQLKMQKNLNSSTLEPDQPQHYRAAGCVIAQQYPSAVFVSLYFHPRKNKSGARFKHISLLITPFKFR